MTGVTVKPSPRWMQKRLAACGARPINNLVDITNYVLLEYGQPLHVFDVTKLQGGTIVVRRAHAKEPLTTLDGVSRALSPDVLVIADAQHAVAVAGVMGGAGSEVTPRTTDVLLESALFDPVTIRRTARQLGLASESSYRFERGVDPLGVEAASATAAALIVECAGGRQVGVQAVGAEPAKRSAIRLDPARMDRWLGTSFEAATIRTTLARLGCRVASSEARGSLHVTPPSFRQDLRYEVDLYEEIARVAGYDRLPTRAPSAAASVASSHETKRYELVQALKQLCAGCGLTEAITWSLASEAELKRCGYASTQAARLSNPLSQDHAYLRPSLLIGLLQSVRRNLTQGALGVRLFEVGSIVPLGGNAETTQLGIVLSGVWTRDWQSKVACDFFRLKGLIQTLAGRLCRTELQVADGRHAWADPGQDVDVQIGGHSIGAAGQVSRAITHALDIEQDVWFAQLAVDELFAHPRTAVAVSAPPLFPPVKRDLSIVVGNGTAFAAITQVIREVGAVLASRVELIDRYTGKPVPSGKSSLTFSIEYRDPTRTLTSAEIDAVHGRIGQTLAERFGATLR